MVGVVREGVRAQGKLRGFGVEGCEQPHPVRQIQSVRPHAEAVPVEVAIHDHVPVEMRTQQVRIEIIVRLPGVLANSQGDLR